MSLLGDRLSPVARLFTILMLLQAGRKVTQKEMAEECGCSAKTIQRDLDVLAEMNYVCTYDESKHTYVLENPTQLVHLSFSLAEVLALAIAEGGMATQEGAPLGVASQIAFKKIYALIPESLQETLRSTPQIIHLPSDTRRDYAHAPWEALFQAIRLRRVCQLKYEVVSRKEITERLVEPYCLTRIDGYWNLIAYCRLRNDIRLFALDAIKGFVLTAETFPFPEDFVYAEFMKGAVGLVLGTPTQVKVRFNAEAAPWAKRIRWRFQHTLTEDQGGSLILEGEVSGLHDLKKELLRWGAMAEALEPPELRKMLEREAKAMTALYSENS